MTFLWSAFTFDWFDTTGLNFLMQTGLTLPLKALTVLTSPLSLLLPHLEFLLARRTVGIPREAKSRQPLREREGVPLTRSVFESVEEAARLESSLELKLQRRGEATRNT